MPQDPTLRAVEEGAKAAFAEYASTELGSASFTYDDLGDNAKAQWRRLAIKAINAYEEALNK